MTDKHASLINIVFFDGYCVLCNRFVDYLIKIDTKNLLKFSSLQGKTANKIFGTKYSFYPNTVVFFKSKHNIYEKSEAVIEIFKLAGGFWNIFIIFKLFPKFIRDFLYTILAKLRYNIFGKRTYCRLPTKEEKDKILP